MKRILLMVILLSVPLCAQTPEAKSTPAAQQSITVSKLPPVTIAKNGIDWAVLANYLLVAVGVGGIAVAIWTLCYIRQQVNEMRRQRKLMLGTLKAIQAQAGHMERQTKILEDSVTAAQTSANAAEKSATAAMGVAVPVLMLEEFRLIPSASQTLVDDLKMPRMSISVKNYGQSPAFLTSFAVQFTCEELPQVLSYPSLLHFDPVEALESRQIRQLEAAEVSPWSPFSEEDAEAIASGTKTLTVYGCVWYGDVFGTTIHLLPFARYAVEIGSGATWIDCDLGERYRASTEEQQRQKPN
jgi:hypothetical protein